MSDAGLITASHRARAAVIYVRQSTLAQVERNRESTTRQYDLVRRAAGLGWPRAAIRVVDADLGVTGSVTGQRDGFESLVAEVALGQVGIILALEVSRLARDNAAWYRLLDLAGACDTLVADADGLYHPGLFNDRLVLGMKGIMSEAELHVLRARLAGAIKNKAARGELRRGLPVGLVWGEGDGEILRHPDEQVVSVISAVFTQFAVAGSARAVWLWLKDQHLSWPLQQIGYRRGSLPEITWVEPTYHAVHTTLTHPAYAGAYVYGRSRQEQYLGQDGTLKKRRRWLPPDQWEVLITGHHEGFTDWDTYQANQARLAGNIRPVAHQPGTGAVREGCALCQGLATCGTCGRKLAVYYDGPARSTPATTAPAATSPTAAASATCGPAAPRSTPPSLMRSWPRCSPPRCKPACWPPASSRPATTPSWTSTAARSSRPATRPAAPNAATGRSTRKTGWSPAAWKPSGTPRCRY